MQYSSLPAPPHPRGRGQVPGPGPGTPRRTGTGLDEIIRQLDSDCQLGLQPRDKTWSPIRKPDSLADKVQGRIKRCYFSSEPALRETLSDFRLKAERLSQEERLSLLHLLLRSQTSSPFPARGVQSQSTPRDESHKSLRDPVPIQSSSSSRPFEILRNDEPKSVYTTAPESPTDDESPPSPSSSIRSVQRRSQESPHASGSMRKKRRSLGFDGGSPPKVPKSTTRRRPSQNTAITQYYKAAKSTPTEEVKREPVPGFKKPTLGMARSYQAMSTQISANTSFNSTSAITSFNSTNQWSSQETQPDTAHTSFNSDVNLEDSPKMTRTSSTTMGSLDTETFDEMKLMLQEEEARHLEISTRESSSTYGSMDEDAVLQASSTLETSMTHSAVRRMIDDPRSQSPAMSPAKLPLNSPRTIASHESASGMSHHIRNIPSQNIFVDETTEDLERFPYFILFICLRIAARNKMPLPELMFYLKDDGARADSDYFWGIIATQIPEPSGFVESQNVWDAAKNSYEGYSFMGVVTYNAKNTEPVFRVELLPLQKEKSCRFQRKFGADRFLYLNFPSFDSGSNQRFNQQEMNQIRDKWREWLYVEHSFLGRKWRVFHVEPTKKAKGPDSQYGTRVILFAIEGIEIEHPCSVGELLDWFFPFGRNLHQPLCKAYARFDLGLSRTTPTMVFKPSQVRYIDDRKADGTPEDETYNDFSLDWGDAYVEDNPIMDDGCSLIGRDAAKEIWEIYVEITGSRDAMPCAFQARIGGAKGLWVVSSGTEPNAPLPMGINITKSQLKFNPHPDDKNDERYDPLRLTFELVNYSTSPTPSDLHLSFVSIMVDRGVPTSVIEDIMIKRLNREREELLNLLTNPAEMYDWVHKQRASQGQELSEMHWQAALPLSLGDRIKLLFESGFGPLEEPYLANCMYRLVKQEQLWEEQKLRVALGKSTFLYGIPDPFGVLEPGEIYVKFSTWFNDDTGDRLERYLCLEDMDVLVARQPACRRSDLQRVRSITHPKLSHLLDVVVFPVKGQYPQAGKLQGGDYDGDIFWLCWEKELVETFKNAPAPTKALDPSQYGIKTFKKTLQEVINPRSRSTVDLSTVDDFLKEAISFRIGASLLGQVTNYLEKQSYAENKVFSSTLDALCDMHDLLVDAPKQGYTFTNQEFTAAKRKLKLPQIPKDPAYKAAMKACATAKEMGAADEIRNKEWKLKQNNVLDYLYFRVVRAHNVETLRMLEEKFFKEINDDEDLQYIYLREGNKRMPTINRELDGLKKKFRALVNVWNSGMTKNGRSTDADQYNAAVDKCYKMFRAIVPDNIDNTPEIKFWTDSYLSPKSNLWRHLRASALYTLYPRKAPFVFHMAGEELAELKCLAFPSRDRRMVSGPIFSILKPKLTKASRLQGEVESDDDELPTE